MNVVELQPTMLPSSFPVSDTRPSLPGSYSKHEHVQSQYVNSRHSSKENRTPPPIERTDYSPPSTQSVQSPGLDRPIHGSVHDSPPNLAAGRKRLANGNVKDESDTSRESPKQPKLGHSRNTSNVSTTSNAAMLEVGFKSVTSLDAILTFHVAFSTAPHTADICHGQGSERMAESFT